MVLLVCYCFLQYKIKPFSDTDEEHRWAIRGLAKNKYVCYAVIRTIRYVSRNTVQNTSKLVAVREPAAEEAVQSFRSSGKLS